MQDRLELADVYSFPVVPNSVVLGISLEQLCRLLEQFWRDIAVTDLEHNLSTRFTKCRHTFETDL